MPPTRMSLAGCPFRYPVKGRLRHASEICSGIDPGRSNRRVGRLPKRPRRIQMGLATEQNQLDRRFRVPAGPPLPSASASPLTSPANGSAATRQCGQLAGRTPGTAAGMTLPPAYPSTQAYPAAQAATPAAYASTPSAYPNTAGAGGAATASYDGVPGGYGNPVAAAGSGRDADRAVRQPRRLKPVLIVLSIRRPSSPPPKPVPVPIRLPLIRPPPPGPRLSGHHRSIRTGRRRTCGGRDTGRHFGLWSRPTGHPHGQQRAGDFLSSSTDPAAPGGYSTAPGSPAGNGYPYSNSPATPPADAGYPPNSPPAGAARSAGQRRRLRQRAANFDARNRLARNSVAGTRRRKPARRSAPAVMPTAPSTPRSNGTGSRAIPATIRLAQPVIRRPPNPARRRQLPIAAIRVGGRAARATISPRAAHRRAVATIIQALALRPPLTPRRASPLREPSGGYPTSTAGPSYGGNRHAGRLPGGGRRAAGTTPGRSRLWRHAALTAVRARTRATGLWRARRRPTAIIRRTMNRGRAPAAAIVYRIGAQGRAILCLPVSRRQCLTPGVASQATTMPRPHFRAAKSGACPTATARVRGGAKSARISDTLVGCSSNATRRRPITSP